MLQLSKKNRLPITNNLSYPVRPIFPVQVYDAYFGITSGLAPALSLTFLKIFVLGCLKIPALHFRTSVVEI